MRIQRVDPANIDHEVIAEAAAIIRRGGLVAFPTETVYGLGADATNAAAVSSIFTTKGRPTYNPLIVHVRDVTQALLYVTVWPVAAQVLARTFWPGPLTIVLPKNPIIPANVTAGLQTVGVRVPNHPVALALLSAAELPIAAPSANRSMHVSPTLGTHVAESLQNAPDLILDAGPVAVGIESTVIDLSTPTPTVLRPGMISLDDLRAAIGAVELVTAKPSDGEARPSPGMAERHYSPRARVYVTPKPGAESVEAVAVGLARNAKLVALARSVVTERGFAVWMMPESPADYARALYETLHRVDELGFDAVVIEALPEEAAWGGLRDRITRAARQGD